MLLNGGEVKYFFIVYMVMSIVCECINDFHCLILTADAGTLYDAGNKCKRQIARTVKKIGAIEYCYSYFVFNLLFNLFIVKVTTPLYILK